MKRCFRCKDLKSSDEFYQRTRSKDGKQAWCKKCAIDNRIQSYKRNPKREREYDKKRSLESRKKIYEHLIDHPCVDCGETDPIVLQFDHLRDKLCNIANISNRYGWKRITEEIEKCVVRCANCHARKTASEQNWYSEIKGG